MKRCHTCRRDYFDDSLTFCLDDGARLLEGPAPDGAATEIMPGFAPPSEASTLAFKEPVTTAEIQPPAKKKIRYMLATVVAFIIVAGFGWLAYSYYGAKRQIESIAVMPFVNTSGNPDIEYLSVHVQGKGRNATTGRERPGCPGGAYRPGPTAR